MQSHGTVLRGWLYPSIVSTRETIYSKFSPNTRGLSFLSSGAAALVLLLVWPILFGDYHRNGICFLSARSPITRSLGDASILMNKRAHIASSAAAAVPFRSIQRLLGGWGGGGGVGYKADQLHSTTQHRLRSITIDGQTQSIWRRKLWTRVPPNATRMAIIRYQIQCCCSKAFLSPGGSERCLPYVEPYHSLTMWVHVRQPLSVNITLRGVDGW